MRYKSPEEGITEKRPTRGGKATREEGGFAEGEFGRGPTPYKKSHSAAPASLEDHEGTSGRGGPGVAGKGDGFKNRAEDLEHPQSHAEFEQLGADGDVGI